MGEKKAIKIERNIELKNSSCLIHLTFKISTGNNIQYINYATVAKNSIRHKHIKMNDQKFPHFEMVHKINIYALEEVEYLFWFHIGMIPGYLGFRPIFQLCLGLYRCGVAAILFCVPQYNNTTLCVCAVLFWLLLL